MYSELDGDEAMSLSFYENSSSISCVEFKNGTSIDLDELSDSAKSILGYRSGRSSEERHNASKSSSSFGCISPVPGFISPVSAAVGSHYVLSLSGSSSQKYKPALSRAEGHIKSKFSSIKSKEDILNDAASDDAIFQVPEDELSEPLTENPFLDIPTSEVDKLQVTDSSFSYEDPQHDFIDAAKITCLEKRLSKEEEESSYSTPFILNYLQRKERTLQSSLSSVGKDPLGFYDDDQEGYLSEKSQSFTLKEESQSSSLKNVLEVCWKDNNSIPSFLGSLQNSELNSRNNQGKPKSLMFSPTLSGEIPLVSHDEDIAMCLSPNNKSLITHIEDSVHSSVKSVSLGSQRKSSEGSGNEFCSLGTVTNPNDNTKNHEAFQRKPLTLECEQSPKGQRSQISEEDVKSLSDACNAGPPILDKQHNSSHRMCNTSVLNCGNKDVESSKLIISQVCSGPSVSLDDIMMQFTQTFDQEKQKIKNRFPLQASNDSCIVFEKPAKLVSERRSKKTDPYFGEYRAPRRKRPRSYVTAKMYRFLERKLEIQFGLEARLKSEEFVCFMCEKVDAVSRRKSNYQHLVNELFYRMVSLKLIKRKIDFHIFIEEYLPSEFRVKAIPCYGCDLGPPPVSYKDLYQNLF